MDPQYKIIIYIGKGQGARVAAYEKEATAEEAGSSKNRKIEEICNSGYKVRKIILANVPY